jgi:N-acetylmuramoyl-L-alanine amidase
VFISIHTNALPGKRIARGLETYTMGMRRSDEKLSAAQRENSVITFEDNYEQHYAGYDPNSPESMIMFEFIHDKNMEKSVELAKLVQTNVCSIAQRQNKGVKQDAFLVLRETSMPACLIELGFISTPDEEDALNNKRIIDRMAYGIYTAFARFKDKNVIVAPYVVNAQHSADVVDNPQSEPMNNTPSDNKVEPVLDRVVTDKEIAEQRIANQTKAPVFSVQFLTGPRVLPEGAKQFKGLTNISHYMDGNTVKFIIGKYNSFAEANAKKREIAALFPDAFIVALQDGIRISLEEARAWRK